MQKEWIAHRCEQTIPQLIERFKVKNLNKRSLLSAILLCEVTALGLTWQLVVVVGENTVKWCKYLEIESSDKSAWDIESKAQIQIANVVQC